MHLYPFALNKEIEEIYANYALYSLAKSMIGIFIPIFLFTLGYPFAQIIVFYMAYFLSFFFFSFPAAILVKKIGAKHVMAISMPFLIIFYILLGIISGQGVSSWLLGTVALIGGFHEAFYWFGFHTDFSVYSARTGKAQQVSLLLSIPLFLTIAGPIAGGICIIFLGFPALFMISSIILLFSIFPLFTSPDFRNKQKKQISLFRRNNWRQAVGYIGSGMREMGFVLFWPIAVYLVVNDAIVLGLVQTIELSFAAIATLGVGFISGKVNSYKLLQSSSVLDAVAWFFKMLAVYFYSLGQIFGISAICGITGSAQSVAFSTMMYNKSQKRTIENLLFRETMLSAGRLLTLLIALVFLLDNIIYALAIISIASILNGFFK